MKITKEQAKQIRNLHTKCSNIGRVFHAYTLIEQVLEILNIKHERYNDKEKGFYMFWRIAKESLEDAE